MFSFLKRKKKRSPLPTYLKTQLGYIPNNIDLFEKALIHKSTNNRTDSNQNNERLEFLGDSVIDLVVAEWLMDSFAQKSEGKLTQYRSRIVNRKNLNLCASKMGLIEWIQFDGKILLENTSIPGNCLEALIGAVYIDAGLEQAKKNVQSLILSHSSKKELEEKRTNYKSQLLEWAQQQKESIEFVISEYTENNRKHFKANVLLNEKELGTGRAKNKKDATQLASKAAIKALNIA